MVGKTITPAQAMSALSQIAVAAAIDSICVRLESEGYRGVKAIVAEARNRGWLIGDEITDSGFEVANDSSHP